MSLRERQRAQRLPESRLSRRMRHAWIHGTLLPEIDPDRVPSSLGAGDQPHFSGNQGLSTGQEDGVGRRAENARESAVSDTQVCETSSTGNDCHRKAIPGHHEGLSDIDAGCVWRFRSFTVLLGDVHEDVHLEISVMPRHDTHLTWISLVVPPSL